MALNQTCPHSSLTVQSTRLQVSTVLRCQPHARTSQNVCLSTTYMAPTPSVRVPAACSESPFPPASKFNSPHIAVAAPPHPHHPPAVYEASLRRAPTQNGSDRRRYLAAAHEEHSSQLALRPSARQIFSRLYSKVDKDVWRLDESRLWLVSPPLLVVCVAACTPLRFQHNTTGLVI